MNLQGLSIEDAAIVAGNPNADEYTLTMLGLSPKGAEQLKINAMADKNKPKGKPGRPAKVAPQPQVVENPVTRIPADDEQPEVQPKRAIPTTVVEKPQVNKPTIIQPKAKYLHKSTSSVFDTVWLHNGQTGIKQQVNRKEAERLAKKEPHNYTIID